MGALRKSSKECKPWCLLDHKNTPWKVPSRQEKELVTEMCAGQWWAAGDMCREEQPVLFTGAFQSNLPRKAWDQTSLSIYASFYIWGN